MNIARIKGIHAAIYSGIEAAKAYVLSEPFDANFRQHKVMQGLKRCRNVRPWFYRGRWIGMLGSGIDQYLFRGKVPYTLRIKKDTDHIDLSAKVLPAHRPDQKISFDLLTLLQLSNTSHRESEPSHITYQSTDSIQDAAIYTYFCPAGVYEIHEQFVINAKNCIHCKACSIRNPQDQIIWRHPEGGGGPNYIET